MPEPTILEEVLTPTNGEAETQPVQAEDISTAPPAYDPDEERSLQKMRDRLAKQGMELSDARRIVQAQAGELAEIKTTIRQMSGQLNAAEEQRVQNYLNSIDDPGQKALAILEIQEQRRRTAGVGRPAPRTASAPQSTEPPDVYRDRRSREIIAEVNQRHGTNLRADETDDDGDYILDFSSEEEFAKSANVAARAMKRASGNQEPAVAKKPQSTSDASAPSKSVSTRPVSSPAAPRPAPAISSPSASRESFNSIVSATDRANRTNFRGPKAIEAALKVERERAARALPNP